MQLPALKIINPNFPMEIISYNVNGLNAAIKKGLLKWLENKAFDIICLQEIRMQENIHINEAFTKLGYHYHYWFPATSKKGYSGVAVFSKLKALELLEGCNHHLYDAEGRVLELNFDNWTLLNCYFPSGTSGEKRQKIKMEFLDYFYHWIQQKKKEQPNLIVVGDFNIAHKEIDIHNPTRNKNTSGFKPEERAWMTKWLDAGFVDAFRFKNPSKKDDYSWWTYRTKARERNLGWRIDYQCVSLALKDKIRNAGHLSDAVHSDHCPVWLDINL